MKLYFSPFSPFVRKCLITAWELGLNERLVLLPSNAHPINRSQALIAENPLGQVPTFHTDDGQVLYDSRVICEYLNDVADGQLFPHDRAQRYLALTQQALGDGMLGATLLARYESVARPEAYQWDGWRDAQFDKVETSLRALNHSLPAWQARLDIGVITVACALWYLNLRFPAHGWQQRFPALAAWYAQISQRPGFAHAWALPES